MRGQTSVLWSSNTHEPKTRPTDVQRFSLYLDNRGKLSLTQNRATPDVTGASPLPSPALPAIMSANSWQSVQTVDGIGAQLFVGDVLGPGAFLVASEGNAAPLSRAHKILLRLGRISFAGLEPRVPRAGRA